MAGDATLPTPVFSSPAPVLPAHPAVPPATNALTVTTSSSPVATTDSNSSSASPRPTASAKMDVVADMHVVQPISVDAPVEGDLNLETTPSQDGHSAPDPEQADVGEEKTQGDVIGEGNDQGDVIGEGNDQGDVVGEGNDQGDVIGDGKDHRDEIGQGEGQSEETGEGNGQAEETGPKTDDGSNKKDDGNVEQVQEDVNVMPVAASNDEVKEMELGMVQEASTNSQVTPKVADDSEEKERQKATEESTEVSIMGTEAENNEKRGEKRVSPDLQPQDTSQSAPQAAPEADKSPAKKQKTDPSDAVGANTESKASKLDTHPKPQAPSSSSPAKKIQTGLVEAGKGTDNTQAPRTSSGASVLGTGMQLMLRSSPVGVDLNAAQSENVPRRVVSSRGSNPPSSSEKGRLHSAVANNGETGPCTTAPVPPEQRATSGEPKKKKRVSWANQEKLVEIKFIDSRLDLFRSWDPESEITIPFSEGQVKALRAEEQSRVDAERAGQKNGEQHGSRKISAFEAARKKEHDMELERAKQARDELQRKLDSMHPSRPWEHPAEIILPAECRIDPDSVEGYSLVEEGYRANLRKRDPNSVTPPSPPPELQSSRDEMIRSDADIPTFPLCDGAAAEAGEVPDPLQAPGTRLRSDGRPDGVMHHRYDDKMGNHRMMGDGEGRLREMDHSNVHETGFRMNPHDRMDRGDEQGMTMDRMPDMMGERGGRPYHPEKLKHILSKLRSSGLFDQNGGMAGGGMDNPEDYRENRRPEEMDGRGGMYEDQHGLAGRGAGRNDGGYHPNGGYPEDDRRGQGMDDGMGPGPRMGMGNGGMGPPQPHFGHPGQMPPGFPPHVQQGGMIDGFPFMAPIPPPPPMGIGPNMLPMGMGMPMPPMGMPMPFGMGPSAMPMGNSKKGGKGGKSGGNNNRVETITRPKSKGSKQRKRCKYFGTKQGCRDGASCVFAHN